jgi:hypothetical protein
LEAKHSLVNSSPFAWKVVDDHEWENEDERNNNSIIEDGVGEDERTGEDSNG